MRVFSLFFFLLISVASVSAQTVYKTPSGKKYHTSVCRYVKNVSESITVAQARNLGLTPCSQCNPGSTASPNRLSGQGSTSGLGIKSGEAQGTLSVAVQCKGTTKAGQRCKRKTKNKNGYCFQHER